MGGGDDSEPPSANTVHYGNGERDGKQGGQEAEELKNQGNHLYRFGRFKEALSKFDDAVSKSPGVAVYRANKAAALSSLGRLGEALQESKKAVELDDTYERAHQRLANLYLRLGSFKEAKEHFKKSGPSGQDREKQAEQLEAHANTAFSARERGDWSTVLRETDAAIQGGADSAGPLLALKTEALLGLRRPEEAEKTFAQAETAAAEGETPTDRDPALQTLQAKVLAANGNFDGAITAAERAVKLDPENPAAIQTLKQTRALAHARAHGNDLFNAGDFPAAEEAYSEGLNNALGQENAFLLSNRAAARAKQGRWEEALSDADRAVHTCPNYSKARLRRVHAYKSLGRWGDAVKDLESLSAGAPKDPDFSRELFEAQKELARSRGEDVSGWNFTPPGGLVEVTSEQQYWEKVKEPGLTVGAFTATWCGACRQAAPMIQKLPKKFPGLTVLKVDIDALRQLAAAENVSAVPTFQVYKGGRKIQETKGANTPMLEQVIRQNL